MCAPVKLSTSEATRVRPATTFKSLWAVWAYVYVLRDTYIQEPKDANLLSKRATGFITREGAPQYYMRTREFFTVDALLATIKWNIVHLAAVAIHRPKNKSLMEQKSNKSISRNFYLILLQLLFFAFKILALQFLDFFDLPNPNLG